MSQGAFDFDSGADESLGVTTLTVRELIDEVNGALRDRFADGVWVSGEIRGYNRSAAGHSYFDLVEERDGQKATISVVFFAGQQARLRPLLQKSNLRLADGMKVRIFGSVDVFAGNGRLSFRMSGIDPRFTLGELAIRRDEVVRRLRAAGLFDANREVEIGAVPLRVGLITSTSSAAYEDFTKELDTGGIGFIVWALDARMQGEECVTMVSAAITRLGGRGDLDVIVLIRGGGSKNDLAAFDSEAIAMAIALCPMPVFTGIGHEIDHSIADDVAHTFFKTPTACARGLIDQVLAFSGDAESAWALVAARSTSYLDAVSSRLDGVAHRLASATRAVVERTDERLRMRALELEPLVAVVLGGAAMRSDQARHRLASASRRHVELASARLDGVDGHVRLLDPALTLARGWSITRSANGEAVRSVTQVPPGSVLVTTVADGMLLSTVVDSNKETS